MNRYIVIYRCEDEPLLLNITEKELKENLVGEWEGYNILTKVDDLLDLMEFPSTSILILKHEIVVPKAVKKVTEYEL